MAYEPRPGDGGLFVNKDRSADNHPHATGYIVAHRDIKQGERLRLAAWTKDGNPRWQALKMSDDRRQQDAQSDESEIPF